MSGPWLPGAVALETVITDDRCRRLPFTSTSMESGGSPRRLAGRTMLASSEIGSRLRLYDGSVRARLLSVALAAVGLKRRAADHVHGRGGGQRIDTRRALPDDHDVLQHFRSLRGTPVPGEGCRPPAGERRIGGRRDGTSRSGREPRLRKPWMVSPVGVLSAMHEARDHIASVADFAPGRVGGRAARPFPGSTLGPADGGARNRAERSVGQRAAGAPPARIRERPEPVRRRNGSGAGTDSTSMFEAARALFEQCLRGPHLVEHGRVADPREPQRRWIFFGSEVEHDLQRLQLVLHQHRPPCRRTSSSR